MWKALLFLFIISDAAPPVWMLATFKGAFHTETECQAFVKVKRAEVEKPDGTLKAAQQDGYAVAGHAFDCMLDESGQEL